MVPCATYGGYIRTLYMGSLCFVPGCPALLCIVSEVSYKETHYGGYKETHYILESCHSTGYCNVGLHPRSQAFGDGKTFVMVML